MFVDATSELLAAWQSGSCLLGIKYNHCIAVPSVTSDSGQPSELSGLCAVL